MNDQEKIDRRILNQMSKAEQAAFDKELSINPKLADSFDFNKDMADFFEDDQPDLEAELDLLGDKYFSKKNSKINSSNKKNWLWLLPILFMGGAIVAYFFSSSEDALNSNPDKVETEISIPNSPENNDIEKETKEIPVIEKQDQKAIEKTPDFYSPPKADLSEPIAALNPADFELNPALEGILRENVRNVNITSVSSPSNEEVLKLSSDLFTLKATTNLKPPYLLTIYSNRSFDFDNDYPVLRREIDGSKDGDEFIIDFSAKTSFTPGLYYLLLQNDKAELMSISKFMVK